MLKSPGKPKREAVADDFPLRARNIAAAAEEEPADSPVEDPDAGKNPHAVALGKLGGLKGGPARAKKLSATKRRRIARHAAEKRWDKGS